jgi:hypothetical protein
MEPVMRAITILTLVLFVAAPLAFTGCGKSDEPGTLEKLSDAAKNMQTAAEEISKSVSEERTPVPPVSFRVLLNYLPETVEGLTRGEPEGESASMGEWQYSQANAEYRSESGEQRVRIEIFDYAYIGVLYTPYTIALKMKFNKESTSGYERSVEIAGSPAFESWNIQSKRAEANLLVGDRYIVKISTDGLPEGAPRRIAAGMNLKKLASEKAEPAS